MHDMVAERPDWCISRQRFWGVPLIIFYCDACGKQLEDFAALRHVLPFFEREGADAWYTHSAEELLAAGHEVLVRRGEMAQGNRHSRRVVRFRLHASRRAERKGRHVARRCVSRRPRPVSRLVPQLAAGRRRHARRARRIEQVVTHGWTLDEKGAPMSKSLGNAMYPNEICDKWGADLLRVWVASQDYTADMRMSEAMMTQLAEAYRKIRNTFRFALSNLFDFDPARDLVADAELWEMDAWMLRRTGALVRAVPRSGTRISNFIASITRCTISAPWI